MVSPKVLHEGLLVPNTVGLTYPRMAEPDQIDFATAANAQWGVVEGCLVTISVTTVTVHEGTAIVNGLMVKVREASTALGVSGSQDRFDSICVNESGNLVVLAGVPAVDPIFRDVPLDNTLLAVVFCPTGEASFDGFVMDKRRFVSKALLTKLTTGTEPLIRNMNGDGDDYRVLGDGTTVWKEDTRLKRKAAGTLELENNLEMAGYLKVSGQIDGGTIKARQEVTGINLHFEQNYMINAPIGALHQNTVNGDISVMTATGWKQLALTDGIMPVGSIIQSVEPPAVMEPKGWVLLGGQVVTENVTPRLFTLTSFQGRIQGLPGSRWMELPDATFRVLRGSKLGPAGAPGGSNSITLRTEQMPRHKHGVAMHKDGGGTLSATMSPAGRHGHVVHGGKHGHPVNDPGHSHNGGGYPFGAFICLLWGGDNKIDALFNDRNHTYSVSACEWINPNYTGITVGDGGSEHVHTVEVDGAHEHAVSISPLPTHIHEVIESEIGNNAAIDITPAFLATYTYIRS